MVVNIIANVLSNTFFLVKERRKERPIFFLKYNLQIKESETSNNSL